MFQSNFSFLHYFVTAKIATSCISVKEKIFFIYKHRHVVRAEYSQVSTHVPGFQSHFSFLHHFVTAKLATSGIRFSLTIYKQSHVVLVEYSQMSTDVPGVHSYFCCFCIILLATSSITVNEKILENHLNTDCYVGSPWIALVEYSQVSTHVTGFQSHFSIFNQFVKARLRKPAPQFVVTVCHIPRGSAL